MLRKWKKWKSRETILLRKWKKFTHHNKKLLTITTTKNTLRNSTSVAKNSLKDQKSTSVTLKNFTSPKVHFRFNHTLPEVDFRFTHTFPEVDFRIREKITSIEIHLSSGSRLSFYIYTSGSRLLWMENITWLPHKFTSVLEVDFGSRLP